MNILKIDNLSQFGALIDSAEHFTLRAKEIHISGQLYDELHQTYVLFKKCDIPKAAGKVGIVGALLGLVTGVLSLISAGVILVTSAALVTLAIKTFGANPYAVDVYCLYQEKFKLIRNSDNLIVLRSP
jgi:hypothetical protein